jgi:hypothetical protein
MFLPKSWLKNDSANEHEHIAEEDEELDDLENVENNQGDFLRSLRSIWMY